MPAKWPRGRLCLGANAVERSCRWGIPSSFSACFLKTSEYLAQTVASTIPFPGRARSTPRFDWRSAGLRYYAYGFHLKSLHGEKVWRVSVDGGFTCPNVDGRVAVGGCTFCDNRSFSPSRRVRRDDVAAQIDRGIAALQRRYGVTAGKYTAYFQPGTNTYGRIDKLRELFETAAGHPQIIALAIGTRPDCVEDEVLDLLAELARRLPVSVEYGMQTMHDSSLRAMNRGHDHQSTIDAVERSRGRGFEICLHLLIGWPTEGHDDVMASAREVARLDVDSVKLHNLYAVDGTALSEQVRAGEVRLLDRDTYVSWAADILEELPPRVVVERLSAHAPPEYLTGPAWCLDGAAIRRDIELELARRGSWQGRRYGCREGGGLARSGQGG